MKGTRHDPDYLLTDEELRDRTLDRTIGLYVGQLDPEEMVVFNEACKAGTHYRDYDGPAGFLGLAKVRRR